MASGDRLPLVTGVKIDLANIAGTPGARGRYPVSERLAPTDDCSFVEPVTGELSVENTSSLLLVRGQLRAVLRLTCARCLTEVEHPLEVEVAEEFATEGTAPGVETIDRDEPEASAISDYVLDLSEFVRQHVAVHLPMAFLCRPDCLGICPSCGRNLNESPCGCQAEPADERWEKLRELALKAPEPKAGPGQR